MSSPSHRPGYLAALTVAGWAALSTVAVSAQERPTPLESHRYVPGGQALDAVVEQEAQAYRSRLAGERLRLERGSDSSRSPAALLRRQGAVNREIDRVEELLNR